MAQIKTYTEFWPHYLREHSLPATRFWHYIGTSLSLLLLVYAVAVQYWGLLIGAVICGYAFAWASHGLIEKNKPATFTYPAWSLVSDFRMLFCFLSGRMGKELRQAGIGQ